MTDYVIGFDPGFTTGVCKVVASGTRQEIGLPVETGVQVKFDKLQEFLAGLDPTGIKTVFIESYIVRKDKVSAHVGSDLKTSQAIGMIKFWAAMHKLPIKEQRPQILTLMEKKTGIPMPKNHDKSHWVSAFYHATYELMESGKMESALERKKRLGTT